MYVEYNPNPEGNRTDDCVVRAFAKAFGIDWNEAYIKIATHAMQFGETMHKNYVWGDLLIANGFTRHTIPNTCPRCYTVADFAADHPRGLYIVGTGEHVVTVINGDWYDTWDSGREVPIIYYWRAENGL